MDVAPGGLVREVGVVACARRVRVAEDFARGHVARLVERVPPLNLEDSLE